MRSTQRRIARGTTVSMRWRRNVAEARTSLSGEISAAAARAARSSTSPSGASPQAAASPPPRSREIRPGGRHRASREPHVGAAAAGIERHHRGDARDRNLHRPTPALLDESRGRTRGERRKRYRRQHLVGRPRGLARPLQECIQRNAALGCAVAQVNRRLQREQHGQQVRRRGGVPPGQVAAVTVPTLRT